jgi:signal peptidase I
MERVVDTVAYLDLVCQLLSEGHTAVPVPVKGVSMRPFLRDGDRVFLDLPKTAIRKGDIVLFRRTNGQYILHRVHRICRDGSFFMLGDSQLIPEPVPAEKIRARVSFAIIGGKTVKPRSLHWWFFAYPWRALAPFRRQIGWVRGVFRK